MWGIGWTDNKGSETTIEGYSVAEIKAAWRGKAKESSKLEMTGKLMDNECKAILFYFILISILGHTSSTVTVTYFSNDFSLVMSVLYQLIKIYGSKRPGYRLLMNSSGCAIAQ